ncbi:uncharacterized protein LOC62_04G005314 [Vanrija pseudolonga]|uniref:Uncharacterized protein n=1 Tax=Vanrija pseudolonga TaxID=143232 RepID=A0AAF1BR71_9TREE|nr:hypothetical protein LOC62_04G005314 [Vanrija pseudolonga]
MPSTIDHTAFPFIIDRIILHAELDALLVIRATSKELRDYIDAIVFSHVRLRDGPPGGYRGPPKRFALFPPRSTPRTALSARHSLQCKTRLPFIAHAVKVLDIHDAGFSYVGGGDRDLPPALMSAFTNVTTLRRLNWASVELKCHAPFGAPVHTVVDDLNTGDHDICTEYHIQCIPGAKRHVAHLRWDQDLNQYCDLDVDVNKVPELEEFVLVLWPHSSGARHGMRGQISQELYTLLHSLLPLAQRGGSIVVVGLEGVQEDQIDPLYSSLSNMDDLRKIQPDPFLLGLFFVWTDYMGNDMTKLYKSITRLTLKQWHDTLSESEKTLIGCRPMLTSYRNLPL